MSTTEPEEPFEAPDPTPAPKPDPRREAAEPEPVPTPVDYAEFQAWKADQAKAADVNGGPDRVRRQIVIELDGADKIYTLLDDPEDVRAYLGATVTFAENPRDRAIAIFEAALEPDDFDRLQADIRPVLRQVRRAHRADPDKHLSVAETWQAMADAVIDAVQELLADPKGGASPDGPSRTGRTSGTGSVRSALPSTT